MLNLYWLRVEEVSWQWSVSRVTVPRLSTWYDVTWYITWLTWRDVTWRDMTWHDVTWRDMTWHDVTWHDVKWCDITRHDATRRYATWRYATWRDMTCDPYLNARMNSTACEMAEILSKNYQNLFRSEAFYRRFIISAPASIKPKSVQNTDFVTQLGKWISAVPESFRMKFSRNVEKLFP